MVGYIFVNGRIMLCCTLKHVIYLWDVKRRQYPGGGTGEDIYL